MGQAALLDAARIGVSGHPLTDEQSKIIARPPTETKTVQAFAGCAKTTTATEFAHAWPGHKGLYLAFNSAIAGDSKGKFPAHIQTQTAHGHAYQAMAVNRFRERLVNRLRPEHLDSCNDLLRPVSQMSPVSLKRAILRSLNNFLISADHQVRLEHLAGFPIQARGAVLSMVSNVIERLMDYERTDLPFTHDIYLKAFSREREISSEFDYLIVDEAQDLNPVLIDIVRRAKRSSMIIGDPYQSIYAFRGAMSAMDQFTGTPLTLSQSFRFGPRVAEVANYILRQSLLPPKIPLKGFEQQQTTVTEYQGKISQRCTLLARTNFRLFEGLVQSSMPFHVVGGIDDMISQVEAGFALYSGERPRIIDPLVSRFSTWTALKDEAELQEEPELTRLVRIIEQYTINIPSILADLRRRHCPDENRAQIIVSTAHKAKGREWDHVIILDDFMQISQLRAMLSRKRITPAEYTAEVNLTYVAATRGRVSLAISQPLFDEIAGHSGLSDQLFDPM